MAFEKIEGRTVIGMTEEITVCGNKGCKTVIARIDTGATVGSVDKELAEKLDLGETVKEKVVKSSHGTSVRPIKKMRFELKGRKFRMNFTIADRSHLKYKILVGQNVLKKDFLVDCSKK